MVAVYVALKRAVLVVLPVIVPASVTVLTSVIGLASVMVVAPAMVLALGAGAATAAALNGGPGEAHSCVVTSVGRIYCWGDNAHGQLGDGNAPVDRPTAGAVERSGALADAEIAQVDTGAFHTCAVDYEGALYCWGYNGAGQLGVGGPSGGSDVPVRVTALGGHDIVSVATGVDHTCALDSDGAVYCWGGDTQGQLGDGSPSADQDEPVAVSVGVSSSLHGKEVSEITAHRGNTCAIDTDGAAHCWGDDAYGQLGDGGDATDAPEPVAVATAGALSGKTMRQIDVGREFACAVDAQGVAYCWGENSVGQLGNDNLGVDSAEPVAVSVSGSSSLHGKTVAKVDAGNWHACALDTGGAAHCWGENAAGQVGNDAASTNVDQPNAVAAPLTEGSPVVDVYATYRHSCAVTSDAVVYCWGDNGSGQLGDGTADASARPVLVVGLPVRPDPPTHVAVVAGDRSLRVSWREPADLGTGDVLGYLAFALPPGEFQAQAGASVSALRAQAAEDGGFCASAAATATACTIMNLTNGQAYAVFVVTVTTDGFSRPSAVVTGRPAAAGAGAGAGLPVTGSGLTAYLILGGVLVAVGAGVVLPRRRRIRWAP